MIRSSHPARIGKTQDTNSNFLAKFMFELAIDLKRIEVIADEEDEIVEAVKRLSSLYDIVITSGGIGPTHDDITFQSIGKAFSNGELVYDQETIVRHSCFSTRCYAYTDEVGSQSTETNERAQYEK